MPGKMSAMFFWVATSMHRTIGRFRFPPGLPDRVQKAHLGLPLCLGSSKHLQVSVPMPKKHTVSSFSSKSSPSARVSFSFFSTSVYTCTAEMHDAPFS